MTFLHAALLSFVEGVTEFLPISSTGHLTLISYLLGIGNEEFVKSFEIIIQLGAIFAVILLYAKRFIHEKRLFAPVIAAFIPTGIIGFSVYPFIKHTLLGNPYIVVTSLFIGGIVLLFIDKIRIKQLVSLDHLPILRALCVGVFQTLSIIPGVSRSAATIIGGQCVGLSKKDAVEFSFFLAIPTMVAATTIDLAKSSMTFSGYQYMLLAVGFTGAFVTAIASIRVFLTLVQKKSFTVFGIYRIALSIIYYFLFLR